MKSYPFWYFRTNFALRIAILTACLGLWGGLCAPIQVQAQDSLGNMDLEAVSAAIMTGKVPGMGTEEDSGKKNEKKNIFVTVTPASEINKNTENDAETNTKNSAENTENAEIEEEPTSLQADSVSQNVKDLEESEETSEEKSPEKSAEEPVKEKEGDTTVIVNLDAQAIDKLKSVEPEKEPSPLNDLVLVEDNSMDIIRLWARFTGFCTSVRRFCSENSGEILFLFIGILVTGILVRVLRFFCDHVILARMIKKTQTLADDHIYRATLPPVLAFFWLLGLLASALPLLEGAHYPQRLILALIAADVTWLLYRLIGAADHIVCLYFRGKQRVFNQLIFDAIRKTLRIALVLFATCFIGQAILRFNVSALLAAAGIFGLAIAFAVKDTISNFLSSFMMLFDRSFQIGDRIRTGNIDGDVEAVDFRSTRIRALNGHLYSIPNAILGVGIIENVSQRPGIRYDFQLGLTYDTKPEQMKKAVEIVRELVSDPQRYIQSPARNLVSFGSFGDWSLNIHGLIWFNTQNYVQSELWKHDLHMAILERFSAEGLEFAFPTQTVSIAKTQEK